VGKTFGTLVTENVLQIEDEGVDVLLVPGATRLEDLVTENWSTHTIELEFDVVFVVVYGIVREQDIVERDRDSVVHEGVVVVFTGIDNTESVAEGSYEVNVGTLCSSHNVNEIIVRVSTLTNSVVRPWCERTADKTRSVGCEVFDGLLFLEVDKGEDAGVRQRTNVAEDLWRRHAGENRFNDSFYDGGVFTRGHNASELACVFGNDHLLSEERETVFRAESGDNPCEIVSHRLSLRLRHVRLRYLHEVVVTCKEYGRPWLRRYQRCVRSESWADRARGRRGTIRVWCGGSKG
jgi:hypothetical protein